MPDEPEPEPALLPKVSIGTSRTGRERFQPQRFWDFIPNSLIRMPSVLPQPPTPPLPEPETVQSPPTPPPPEPSPPPKPTLVTTDPDEFGLYRVYSQYPMKILDEEIEDEDMCEGAGYWEKTTRNPLSVFGLSDPNSDSIFAPFLNATVFRLMNWFYGPKNAESVARLDSLVNDIILADDFDRNDLTGFRTQRELDCLDKYARPSSNLRPKDGWIEALVNV
ncbi:hypothetical protein AAF712_013706 [Marasmius tenuissimus]|uniref:Uncharacterized protein n=1 Tax=Marasmius tenuissimus TaxID=585030 RepID=A0ABR2ZD85_9AGAR